MIRNNRGKKSLRFGFGSPYLKPIEKLKLLQQFPDGSVFQVMPPSSAQEEILKGNTNGDVSSAYPNKDTRPPDLTQEGKGLDDDQNEHFEVNNYDFSIDEAQDESEGKGESQSQVTDDLKSNASKPENMSGNEEESDSQIPDKQKETGSVEIEKLQTNVNHDNFLDMLEYSDDEAQSSFTDKAEIENWFYILD